jgi:V/A-type H+-transporting ATPase subunit E
MDYENLMKSMDSGAEDKIAELTQRARKTSEEIKSRALAKADEIKKLHMDSALKAAMLEKNKSLYMANSEAKKQIGNLKHELFNEAFARVHGRLASVRESGYYEDSFRRMAEEAVLALGESEVILHIDKKDADLCRKVADGLGVRCEIIADNDCMGGLIVTTKDGKVVVYNTVESRLENARRRRRLEIFNMLYSGSG